MSVYALDLLCVKEELRSKPTRNNEGRVKVVRGKLAGIQMADALMEFLHMMYNADTARRVVEAMIEQLTKRKGEFVNMTKHPNDKKDDLGMLS